jgi:hypothetical protein
MKTPSHFLARASALATALAIAGCTYNTPTQTNPTDGAILGGITGAALGSMIGDDTKSAIVGGVLGRPLAGPLRKTWPTKRPS